MFVPTEFITGSVDLDFVVWRTFGTQSEHSPAKFLFDLSGGQIQHSRTIPSHIACERGVGGKDFLGRDRIIRGILDAEFNKSFDRSGFTKQIFEGVFLFVTLLDDSATSQQFQRTFAPPRKDTFPFFMEQEFIKTLDPLEILRLLAVDPDHTAFEGIPTAPEIQRQVSIASDDDVEGAPDIDPGVPVLLFRRQEVIPGKLLEGIDLVSGQSIILNVLCC